MTRHRSPDRGYFDGFAEQRIDTGDAQIFARSAGNGPAVLLLHGHPRTSGTWHGVARQLVDSGFAVVCPDLRGYGRSSGPPPSPDHTAHSKRAMADDMFAVMEQLGHPEFAVVGHDRGSYVAFRMALDLPDVVTRVALLDSIPIIEHLERMTPEFATQWWHWFFFAQPDIPERVISADPDSWYRGDPAVMGVENHAEWRAATRNPAVVRAMLDDYRAGLTVDAQDERNDRRRGVRLHQPLLVAWSAFDDLEQLFGDPIVIWRNWADDVTGVKIPSGHHMAEEAPDLLADALATFMSRR
ncbi:MAG: alpha/beta hydrolase [Actinomycetota bacterium]|nr:alpha/beta hydrolase [Actinomycetota bacterium]